MYIFIYIYIFCILLSLGHMLVQASGLAAPVTAVVKRRRLV